MIKKDYKMIYKNVQSIEKRKSRFTSIMFDIQTSETVFLLTIKSIVCTMHYALTHAKKEGENE